MFKRGMGFYVIGLVAFDKLSFCTPCSDLVCVMLLDYGQGDPDREVSEIPISVLMNAMYLRNHNAHSM